MSGTGRNVMDKKQTKKIQDMPEAEEMDRLIEEGGFSMSNIDKYYGKDVCDKIREYTSAIDKMQAEAYEKIKQYDGVELPDAFYQYIFNMLSKDVDKMYETHKDDIHNIVQRSPEYGDKLCRYDDILDELLYEYGNGIVSGIWCKYLPYEKSKINSWKIEVDNNMLSLMITDAITRYLMRNSFYGMPYEYATDLFDRGMDILKRSYDYDDFIDRGQLFDLFFDKESKTIRYYYDDLNNKFVF